MLLRLMKVLNVRSLDCLSAYPRISLQNSTVLQYTREAVHSHVLLYISLKKGRRLHIGYNSIHPIQLFTPFLPLPPTSSYLPTPLMLLSPTLNPLHPSFHPFRNLTHLLPFSQSTSDLPPPPFDRPDRTHHRCCACTKNL